MEALSQTFVVAFPEIQQVANERGCRPILDMPFYERSGGKLVPLQPDCVIDQLEKLEEKYLDGFMAQHRFCVEGERHLETKDGWVWFRLHPGRSEEEGKAMRHCGNVPSWVFGDYIYSLREPVEKDGEVFGNLMLPPPATVWSSRRSRDSPIVSHLKISTHTSSI